MSNYKVQADKKFLIEIVYTSIVVIHVQLTRHHLLEELYSFEVRGSLKPKNL